MQLGKTSETGVLQRRPIVATIALLRYGCPRCGTFVANGVARSVKCADLAKACELRITWEHEAANKLKPIGETIEGPVNRLAHWKGHPSKERFIRQGDPLRPWGIRYATEGTSYFRIYLDVAGDGEAQVSGSSQEIVKVPGTAGGITQVYRPGWYRILIDADVNWQVIIEQQAAEGRAEPKGTGKSDSTTGEYKPSL